MTVRELADLVIYLAAVAGAITTLGLLVRGWIRSQIREPMEEMRRGLRGQIAEIRDEVIPNHGRSLRDAVNRIERAQDRLERQLADHLAEQLKQQITEPRRKDQ